MSTHSFCSNANFMEDNDESFYDHSKLITDYRSMTEDELLNNLTNTFSNGFRMKETYDDESGYFEGNTQWKERSATMLSELMGTRCLSGSMNAYAPAAAAAEFISPGLVKPPGIFSAPKQLCPIRLQPFLNFGSLGPSDEQFLEPNGITLTDDGYVIVADTNNHKIKFFDLNGRFLYKFGSSGKASGKILYPCKVTHFRKLDDLVIIQRNPMPQIQIFSKHGKYMHRFGNGAFKYPRAVCVDELDRIFVIESKVMLCHIFSNDGSYLKKLDLSEHLNFPYDICAQEGRIYISDNQSHCVKVFNYDGALMGRIGEGVVRFPIAVQLVPGNRLLIADNHENFNLNLFTIDGGQHVQSFVSGTKHAQCYDIATDARNNLVLASKDYRVYAYKIDDTHANQQSVREWTDQEDEEGKKYSDWSSLRLDNNEIENDTLLSSTLRSFAENTTFTAAATSENDIDWQHSSTTMHHRETDEVDEFVRRFKQFDDQSW